MLEQRCLPCEAPQSREMPALPGRTCQRGDCWVVSTHTEPAGQYNYFRSFPDSLRLYSPESNTSLLDSLRTKLILWVNGGVGVDVIVLRQKKVQYFLWRVIIISALLSSRLLESTVQRIYIQYSGGEDRQEDRRTTSPARVVLFSNYTKTGVRLEHIVKDVNGAKPACSLCGEV